MGMFRDPDSEQQGPPPPRGKDIKPLRLIKGGWTAGGHAFDDRMACTNCRRTWQKQQSRPSYCAKA